MSSKKSDAQRQRIIDAALTLFARFGVRKTTVSALAQRAHLGKGTIYYYFPDGKEAIFAAAVQSVVEQVFRALVACTEQVDDAWEKIAAYMRGRIIAFDRELIVRGIEDDVWRELRPQADDVLAGYLVREFELLGELVALGVKQGLFELDNVRLAARSLQAMLQGLTVAAFDTPSDSTPAQRQQEIDQLLELIRFGLNGVRQ
ncbi:MAG: TetR/AcrR family transcriptional regulator [Deltaproteobacteria bacterium]|nr:TetR/AcrR family transcriptional regulator [Deltaproteobacteria bacterium]